MEFNKVTIKNFRNFENIEVNLTNKNVFFGMNDIGKTNFLYAIRFVFDRHIRKNGFLESDFYKCKIEEDIEIIVELGLEAEEEDANLRAHLGGALFSEGETLYIKLIAKYDQEESIGTCEMFWGNDFENLQEIKSNAYSFDLDKVFKVVFIDSQINLEDLFKKNIKNIIDKSSIEDLKKLEKIKANIKNINDITSSLDNVIKVSSDLSIKLKRMNKTAPNVVIKSDININGPYSNLLPYISNDENDENIYPTSGDGRKKLLAYSLIDMIREENDLRIPIYLVEEPENHLHRSMQIALSKMFFSNNDYKYLFITTHSPYILYEMDEVNLIRVYNDKHKIDTKSECYRVEDEYKSIKKTLNRNLSEALFANTVLLIEGNSELILFNYIFEYINTTYESDGKYILCVEGVGFKKYNRILNKLNIKTIIKTDNDLQKYKNHTYYTPTGFKRCFELYLYNDIDFQKLISSEIEKLENVENDGIQKDKSIDELVQNAVNTFIDYIDKKLIFVEDKDMLNNELIKIIKKKYVQSAYDNIIKAIVAHLIDCTEKKLKITENKDSYKRAVYKEFDGVLKNINLKKIYISEVSLEQDIRKILGKAEAKKIEAELNTNNLVNFLKLAKVENMNKLIEFLDEDNCEKIYHSDLFVCLKEFNHE